MKTVHLEPLKKQLRDKMINFKLSTEEQKIIKEKALKHADGNISNFIRHAALKWTPTNEK